MDEEWRMKNEEAQERNKNGRKSNQWTHGAEARRFHGRATRSLSCWSGEVLPPHDGRQARGVAPPGITAAGVFGLFRFPLQDYM